MLDAASCDRGYCRLKSSRHSTPSSVTADMNLWHDGHHRHRHGGGSGLEGYWTTTTTTHWKGHTVL